MPTVMIEFQQICTPASMGIRAAMPETGRYPARRPQDTYALPLAEYLRQAARDVARIAQELDIVLTNSDGRRRSASVPSRTPWPVGYEKL